MPKPPLPEKMQAVLAKPNPCVIATLRPDGAPISVATWYLWEDGHVLVNMDASRKRLEYLRKDPRVSLSILDEESWYQAISLYGRVTEMFDDPDLVDIDRLSTHYMGQPYGVRDSPRISAIIEIDEYAPWGYRERS